MQIAWLSVQGSPIVYMGSGLARKRDSLLYGGLYTALLDLTAPNIAIGAYIQKREMKSRC